MDAPNFTILMYETIKEPGERMGASTITPVGIQTGMGVRVGANHKLFEQGPTKVTNHQLDFSIEGKGFFPIQLSNGEVAYTRSGSFHLDPTGKISLAGGAQLIPQITIPANATKFMVTPAGEAQVILPDGSLTTIGQMQLVNFINEQGLNARGAGIYKPTLASGQPIQGIPGENGLGQINQGSLEASNVNVANSMVDMIATQRAYEMGTKVMGVADQMLGATANIK